ncbi:hypothetical protein [Endozoicomonas sp. SESOKO1]|uniref:hypothetical protein n=1 Tax=Endozoicomonas sp. SESOKO1 TaxID=2828742 RepID=UPI002148B1D4|nr:hypothetical protein [Endozoicomonas sp. SESOKO1]
MKVMAVAVAGMLLAGAVQAADQVEDIQRQGMVCYSMGPVNSERQSSGRGMAPDLSVNIAPTFYITSDRDYAACREMAAEKGAHVIIDPNA